MDVLFVNPGSAKDVYQSLSTDYSGIGTPYWALLLSQSCRSQGYKVGILDILAEQLSREQAVERIQNSNPRLIAFCVYGENVNSGTTPGLRSCVRAGGCALWALSVHEGW